MLYIKKQVEELRGLSLLQEVSNLRVGQVYRSVDRYYSIVGFCEPTIKDFVNDPNWINVVLLDLTSNKLCYQSVNVVQNILVFSLVDDVDTISEVTGVTYKAQEPDLCSRCDLYGRDVCSAGWSPSKSTNRSKCTVMTCAGFQPRGVKVLAGRRYRHFKGEIYVVDSVAWSTETNEWVVIYHNILQDQRMSWCRPQSMFTGLVDKSKYPDSLQTLRFELLP